MRLASAPARASPCSSDPLQLLPRLAIGLTVYETPKSVLGCLIAPGPAVGFAALLSRLGGEGGGWLNGNSYLVDPASSHMLVSKIKPCMSKYKQIHTVKLRMAH